MVVATKSYDLIVALLRSKELRSDAELIQLVRGWRTRAIHTCRTTVNVRRAYSGYLPVSPPIDPHETVDLKAGGADSAWQLPAPYRHHAICRTYARPR